MKNYLTHLIISFCLLFEGMTVQAQLRNKLKELEITATGHVGFVRPEKVTPVSRHSPIGGEITIGSLQTTEQAWRLCNCFHRSGWYANYYHFRNPKLGQTLGTGFYVEPLLFHRAKYNLSVRVTVGVSYINQLYHPVQNPNRNFSSSINGMTGLGIYGRKRISERLELVGMAAIDYRHISNAGIRQPNQGINIPSIVAGIAYGPPSVEFPNTSKWRSITLNKRWFGRALLITSVRVYAADDQYPETPRAMVGVNGYAGYRFTQSHALSTGIEVIDDGYMREQMMRANYKGTTQQATWLVGYELWQGRISFTAHFGWNFLRPGANLFRSGGYRPATYEKYGLLYRFNNGLTAGVVVKAFGENTKGFQLAVGGDF